MIADSSVWVDYLRGTTGAETRRLRRALEREEPLSLVPPVLQEVLQGANGIAQFARWETLLERLPLLAPRDPWTAGRDAALLYMRCRNAGLTIRSPNDCLIAVLALEFDLPILHRDRDFVHIAQVEPRVRLARLSSAGRA